MITGTAAGGRPSPFAYPRADHPMTSDDRRIFATEVVVSAATLTTTSNEPALAPYTQTGMRLGINGARINATDPAPATIAQRKNHLIATADK